MAGMRILTANEQAAFERPPAFGHRKRKRFFDLPKGLTDTAATLRTHGGQIGFLLMCGHFKAAKRFCQPQDIHERDIEVAVRLVDLKGTDFSPDAYAWRTRARRVSEVGLGGVECRHFGLRGCLCTFSGQFSPLTESRSSTGLFCSRFV